MVVGDIFISIEVSSIFINNASIKSLKVCIRAVDIRSEVRISMILPDWTPRWFGGYVVEIDVSSGTIFVVLICVSEQ